MVHRVESEVTFLAEAKTTSNLEEKAGGVWAEAWVNGIRERDGITFGSVMGFADDGGLAGIVSMRADEFTSPCISPENLGCRVEASVELGSDLDEVKLVLTCPLLKFRDEQEAKDSEATCNEHHQVLIEFVESEIVQRGFKHQEAVENLSRAKKDLEEATRRL